MARKLANVFKNNCPKKPMSHIMFGSLMNPMYLLTVLDKN